MRRSSARITFVRESRRCITCIANQILVDPERLESRERIRNRRAISGFTNLADARLAQLDLPESKSAYSASGVPPSETRTARDAMYKTEADTTALIFRYARPFVDLSASFLS